MNMYRSLYTNSLYSFGDTITQEEYDTLENKSQFEFWYNTSEENPFDIDDAYYDVNY